MKLYRYRYTCSTESAQVYQIRTEDEGLPTACPNNSGHTIDAGSITIVEIWETDEVTAKIKDYGDIENYITRTKGFEVDIAQGESESTKDITFPYFVYLKCGEVMPVHDDFDYGDEFCAYVVPPSDGACGQLTADKEQGVDVLNVDATAFASLSIGYHAKFGSTDTTHYEIIDKPNTNQIKILPALASAKSNTDAVKMRIYKMENVFMIKNCINPFGGKVTEPSPIPSGWTCRARYNHKNSPSKDDTIRFNLSIIKEI